jgi:hypothetical protein
MPKYDVRQNGYVVDLDRRQLEGSAKLYAGSMPDWSDRAYGHKVDTYYGAPPLRLLSQATTLKGPAMEAPPWRDIWRLSCPLMSRAIAA